MSTTNRPSETNISEYYWILVCYEEINLSTLRECQHSIMGQKEIIHGNWLLTVTGDLNLLLLLLRLLCECLMNLYNT